MLQCNRQGLCHLCHCHLPTDILIFTSFLRPKVTFPGSFPRWKHVLFLFTKLGDCSPVTSSLSDQTADDFSMIPLQSASLPLHSHWRLKGMTSPKNTYSFGHLHCFNSTMYAYCLLGRPKNDRPSSQKLWPNLIFGLIGPLKLQCKTSNWWPEPIYGSIMLKTCVCHFLTKLHPFFTYEGGKKIGPT